MYVIYSEEETRLNEDLGPAFWNCADGWTDYWHADVYDRKPSGLPTRSILITRNAAMHLYKLYKILKEAEVE